MKLYVEVHICIDRESAGLQLAYHVPWHVSLRKSSIMSLAAY